VNEVRFSAERGFLEELDALAAPLNLRRLFAAHDCCQPSVVLTALESRRRRCGRTEF